MAASIDEGKLVMPGVSIKARSGWVPFALSACVCACHAASEPERQLTPASTTMPSLADAGHPAVLQPTDNPKNTGIANPTVGDGGVVVIADAGPCGVDGCADTAVPDDDDFTVAEGDCDDHNPLVNPGAYDVPNNGIDEDCQGGDAKTDACDDALDIASTDPLAAARAIELCPTTDETSRRWGVISARWTTPDGMGKPGGDKMHGLLPGFGPSFAPRGGKTLLAISSGVARAPDQAGYTESCSDEFPTKTAKFPSGFDGTSSTCPADSQATDIADAIALEVRVRMPSNVTALSFDSAFFTEEYPDFICSPFNDEFQVIVQPQRDGGSGDGNVVFDLDGNSVSVNNSLLRVCTPGNNGGKDFTCPLGFAPLKGTGYDNCPELTTGIGLFGGIFGGGNTTMSSDPTGASTGWLNTEFKVAPSEIVTLRLAIRDSGDCNLDSLAVIDHVNFRMRDKPPPADKPMTKPVVLQ